MTAARDDLARWLLTERAETRTPEALIGALVERLVAAGIPLWRLRVSLLAMHPQVFARSVGWQRGGQVGTRDIPMDQIQEPAYVGSPVEAIHRGADLLRCRLDVPEDALPYPQLRDFKQGGATDYAIFALEFSDGRRTYLSVATDDPAGFTEAQIATLQALMPLLSLRLELASSEYSGRTLLQVYLGPNASERVANGDFRRGTGQLLRAAIWLCDLRGFTALVDRLPLPEVIPILDRYFEVMAGPIAAQGGEILKFVGDAVLAVFPTGDDEAAACRRALTAARDALDAFSADPLMQAHGLRVGIGLNLGEVMYGNIGAKDRLDFTVIGSAVNEASRMEGLCKTLGTPLVIAEAVARHGAELGLRPLGAQSLRGVSTARSLFTLEGLGAPPPDEPSVG